MKKSHFLALVGVSSFCFSINATGKDLSNLSLILNPGRSVPITKIDSETYWINPTSIDLPGGDHVFETYPPSRIFCSTKPGYVYQLNSGGCRLIERRMDFDGAKEHWEKIDAEAQRVRAELQRAHDERNAQLDLERKQKAESQYVSDSELLKNASTRVEIELILKSVEDSLRKGVVDRDNIVEIAHQKLQVAMEAEAKIEKKEQERQAKLENERKAKERAKIAVFRKSLAEGVDTNCGPVIEARGKLVKVYFPVANYGNEHWIRRDALFPSGYGCRFYNGEYQPQAD